MSNARMLIRNLFESAGIEPPKVSAPATPEFQAWFEGSKIVDSEGKPLPMFHGTPYSGFEEFRTPAFFTAYPEYAEMYVAPAASALVHDKSRGGDRDVAQGVYITFIRSQPIRHKATRTP